MRRDVVSDGCSNSKPTFAAIAAHWLELELMRSYALPSSRVVKRMVLRLRHRLLDLGCWPACTHRGRLTEPASAGSPLHGRNAKPPFRKAAESALHIAER